MKSGKERKTFVSIYNFPPVLVLPVTRGAAKLLGIHFSSKTIRGAAMRGIIRPPHRKPTQAVTLRISRDGNVSREFSIFSLYESHEQRGLRVGKENFSTLPFPLIPWTHGPELARAAKCPCSQVMSGVGTRGRFISLHAPLSLNSMDFSFARNAREIFIHLLLQKHKCARRETISVSFSPSRSVTRSIVESC